MLAALAVLVAGCGIGAGGSQGEGGGGGGAAEGEVGGEITFQTLQLKPTFNDYINGVIRDFEEQNPGTSVRWVDIPFEGASQKVIADASADQLPDVINLNPDFALQLAEQDAFVNMDEAAADVKGDYVEGAWSAFDFPRTEGGVALPWYLSTELTMYNAEHFGEAGLDPNDPPETLDDLFEYARTIAEETDHYGMHPALENRLLMDLPKLGVPITNEDATEATFNTPEAVAYVEALVSMYEDGVLPPDSVTQTHQDEINAYQAGQISLFPSGPNFLPIIEENAPEIARSTRVGPQWEGEGGMVGMSAMGVLVPRSSDNQATAMEFAKFVTNAENQLAFSKVVPILPSTTSSLEDPYFTDVQGNDQEAQARRISAEQIKNAQVLPPSAVSEEFNQVLVDNVQAAMLGELSPEEAMSRAEEQANAVLGEGR